MAHHTRYISDVLIIGSGVAGLSLALYLNKDISVNVISKYSPEDTSTSKAQGGIACVTALEDTFSAHIDDTLKAGAGLCNRDVVEMVVRNAPERIADIREWGVQFSQGENGLELGREGGHSKRRILHKEDHTGEEVEKKVTGTGFCKG